MKLQLQGRKKPDSIVVMEKLSSVYGWTPNQIRSMRLEDVLAYIDINAMKNAIEKQEYNKAKNGRK